MKQSGNFLVKRQLTGVGDKALPTLYIDSIVDFTTVEPDVAANQGQVYINSVGGNSSTTAQAVLQGDVLVSTGQRWVALDKYKVEGTVVTESSTGVSYRLLADGITWQQVVVSVGATIIDASAAVYNQTLPSATGTGNILYWVLEDKTNTATLSPSLGESLNGVVDASFLFSNYEVGTQFQAVDRSTGNWEVSIVGASQSLPLEYARIETSGNGSITVAGIDLFTAFNTSILDSTGTMVDLPNDGIIAPTTGLYRVSGGMNLGDLDDDNIGIGFRINGVDVYLQTGLNSTDDGNNSASDVIGASLLFEINAGDLVQMILESDNEGGTYSKAYLEIQRQPKTEVVLAGMVPIEDSKFLLGSASGLASNSDVSISDTWGNLKNTYEKIEFELITTSGSLNIRQSVFINTDNWTDGTRAVWYSDAATDSAVIRNMDINGTTANLFLGGVATTQATINIYGHKSQKTIINSSESEVNDQTSFGYYDIGNMRMQWGSSVSTGTTSHSVIFPTAFPDTSYSVVCQTTSGGNGQTISIISKTTTGFSVTTVDVNGSPQNNSFDWQAIGLKP